MPWCRWCDEQIIGGRQQPPPRAKSTCSSVRDGGDGVGKGGAAGTINDDVYGNGSGGRSNAAGAGTAAYRRGHRGDAEDGGVGCSATIAAKERGASTDPTGREEGGPMGRAEDGFQEVRREHSGDHQGHFAHVARTRCRRAPRRPLSLPGGEGREGSAYDGE